MMWFVAELRAVGDVKGAARVDRGKILEDRKIKHEMELKHLEELEEEEKARKEGEIRNAEIAEGGKSKKKKTKKLIAKEKEMEKKRLEEEELAKKKVAKEKNPAKHFLKASPRAVIPPTKKKRNLNAKKAINSAPSSEKKTESIYKLSKTGASSWIQHDSQAVYTYLDACSTSLGVDFGPLVPNHLFKSENIERNKLLLDLITQSRRQGIYTFEDDRKNAFAKAKVAACEVHVGGGSVGAFSIEDAKRAMLGEIRMSGLKRETVRKTAIYRTIRRPVLGLYSGECTEVRFNTFACEALKQCGMTRLKMVKQK